MKAPHRVGKAHYPTEQPRIEPNMPKPDKNPNNRFAIAKIRTGIRGLDEMLHGGLPAGRMTLVSGGPGTGKTLLALEFLYRKSLAGEAVLFLSFEERAQSFRLNARSLGWDLAALEQSGRLGLMNPELSNNIVKAGRFDIQGLLAILAGRVKALGARCIVLDALDAVLRTFSDERQQMDQLDILRRWLDEMGLTGVLTVKVSPRGDAIYPFLDYMADCVLYLDQRMNAQVRTRRVRVIKYRGSDFMGNEYPYVISGGIRILPVSGISLVHNALGERMTSGHPGFDQLLGGGFRRSASILLAGASGTGKTTLANIFVRGICQQGERVLYLNFEESGEAMVDEMLSVGIDLHPFLEQGLLEIRTAMPEAMGVESHLLRIFDILESFNPRHVIVDAISACRRMGSPRAGFDLLVRLLNACKKQGITCMFINQSEDGESLHQISTIGISSLIDTAIVLEYLEAAGELQRRLLVLKSRGSRHSSRFSRMIISDDGIELPAASEPAGA